jgi:hypothetical protein
MRVPDVSTQRQLVNRLIEGNKAAGELKETLSKRRAALDRLPAALLREAFNGNV